ncbi:hypothetical protein FD754_007211 [Muntiacus muntjak]|uniref:LRAT domain-containing protein n=1 Tax=Muntiacus muntjak TaxID=9888 RepID=A0A5N3WQL3_MUNMU|nr:hypothetical protein FD754_007211 [Muntiacus muntjak]
MKKPPEPQPGDLIEIFRPFYRHWAVYIGNGYVVHLAPPSEIPGAGAASVMSALADKAFVKKERLCDVVGRDRYHVNNKHDGRYSPLPPSKIVQRAEELVGQEVLYKLTSENCEHFVNELRYGVPRSDQVKYHSWWFSRSVVSDSCDPMGCSALGFSVDGIFQARILEWVAIW